MTRTLTKFIPSAMPSDADIAAWQDLPRDDRVRLMQEALAYPDCGQVGTASMAELRARGSALAEKLRNG
jgi:hypothetical protein